MRYFHDSSYFTRLLLACAANVALPLIPDPELYYVCLLRLQARLLLDSRTNNNINNIIKGITIIQIIFKGI